MSRRGCLVLLIALVTVVAIYGTIVAIAWIDSAETIKQQLEPYGGCDEAYLYPDTEGAQLCKELSHD